MESLARGDSPLHHLHPGIKLIATVSFILAVVSHPPDAVTPLFPYLALLLLIWAMAAIPSRPLLRKLRLATPFALTLGLFNPLLDTTPFPLTPDWTIRHGWLTLAAIVLKLHLTLGASLLLMATTRLGDLTGVAARLGLSSPLLATLTLLYRYLFLLADEAASMRRSIRLRTLHDRPFSWRIAGALLGQLLLRSRQRAQRLHLAMLARGFTGRLPALPLPPLRGRDLFYGGIWIGLLLGLRYADPVQHLGNMLLGSGP
ncbi:MAG: cobalt ECF transporter T component CbiQ [Magnetococcales bacterium]|nr:cobalt ECF transporter T component CbiQ [Magnetococcales bacterium]